MQFSAAQDVRLKNYRTWSSFYWWSLSTVSKFCLPPTKKSRVQVSAGTSPETLRPSQVVETRFSWRKVWNGVKCNFSSVHHHHRNVVGKLSIRQVRMWNFTRIGLKTKKLWLSIVPARRRSEHTGFGPPQKGVNCNFPWPEFDKPYGVRKLSISDA